MHTMRVRTYTAVFPIAKKMSVPKNTYAVYLMLRPKLSLKMGFSSVSRTGTYQLLMRNAKIKYKIA